MNRIYRSIFNLKTGTFIAVSEHARSAGKKSAVCNTMSNNSTRFTLKTLAASLLVACGSSLVYAQPTGGVVSAGSANISAVPGNMTINQTSQNVAINWQSFNIDSGKSVNFVQPNSSSVALNRVLGSDASSIMGSLSANGKVFLVNPNGVLFGKGASVNVGGLVASTLNITDADFMNNNYKFSGTETGTVRNEGTINATDGGFVALLGANVSNQGVIAAKLGTVALAAGKAMTLDVAGDQLLNIVVDQDVVNSLVENGGLIQANGGQVLMTTQTAGSLLANAVNNTGVIQAQTIQNVDGTIKLLAGMQNGSMLVAGTIDASAPTGGDGGFIETSAATVRISDAANITTLAPLGQTGTWLIDPQDFNIGDDPETGNNANISGLALSGLLVTNSVIIRTSAGSDTIQTGTPPVTNLYPKTTAGNGDININDALEWTATPSPTTLTLIADGDVNIRKYVRPTDANFAILAGNDVNIKGDGAVDVTVVRGNFEVCCGNDINVDATAAITTTNGSILLAAGRDINMDGAVTTTDGNITFCADEDINFGKDAALTLSRGSTIPSQSLGLPSGLVLNAGYGNKPSSMDGTVKFDSPATKLTVKDLTAPVTIRYNPEFYTAPTDYSTNFTLTEGATLTQYMLVYAKGEDRVFKESDVSASLSGLIKTPLGISLEEGLNPTATFDNADVGENKTITFSGYVLEGTDGANVNDFALAADCCSNVLTTTGTISAPTGGETGGGETGGGETGGGETGGGETGGGDTGGGDTGGENPVTPPVVVPPVVVTPIIQPTPSGKLPPIFVVPPLLTLLPVAELPTVEVYVPPVEVAVPPVEVAVPPVVATVPAETVVIPQPPVTYVPPVYLPKQDRN